MMYNSSQTYWKLKEAVCHNGDISVMKGVRQGCVVSPNLFSMYTEMIILEDKGGIRIGGRAINILRYADDTVILVETGHELQHLMDIVVQESETERIIP